MVSKYEKTCPICHKKFSVNGYWWNQQLIHHYVEYRYLFHCLIAKHGVLCGKSIFRFLVMTVVWPALLLFQMLMLPVDLLDVL